MKTLTLQHLCEHKQYYPDNYDCERQAQSWFGFDNITPAVWVKYAVHPNGRVDLWTIETKPEYRHQGYATQALNLVREKYGVDKIHHDGGYTPEGFNYVAHQLEWVSHNQAEPKISFRSMNFVEEWNINTAY